jgi:hypothetical protein
VRVVDAGDRFLIELQIGNTRQVKLYTIGMDVWNTDGTLGISK